MKNFREMSRKKQAAIIIFSPVIAAACVAGFFIYLPYGLCCMDCHDHPEEWGFGKH
jgi:hypothetical protein